VLYVDDHSCYSIYTLPNIQLCIIIIIIITRSSADADNRLDAF